MKLTESQRVQIALRYPGVPVLRFGSQALAEFHKGKWSEYPLQRYYSQLVYYRIPGQGENSRLDYVKIANTTAQYIVDHGTFLTLNTLISGQCSPRMEDIEIY